MGHIPVADHTVLMREVRGERPDSLELTGRPQVHKYPEGTTRKPLAVPEANMGPTCWVYLKKWPVSVCHTQDVTCRLLNTEHITLRNCHRNL